MAKILCLTLLFCVVCAAYGEQVCKVPGNHSSSIHHKRYILDDCCNYCNINCYGGKDSEKQCCGYDSSADTCYYCSSSSSNYCCSNEGDPSSGICCEKSCGCMDCENNGSPICEERTGGGTGKKCCRTSCCNGKCCPEGKKCAGGTCCPIAKACDTTCCGSLHVCHNGQCRQMYNTLELGFYIPSLIAMITVCVIFFFCGCRMAKRAEDDTTGATNGDYVAVEYTGPSLGVRLQRVFYYALAYPYENMFVQLLFRLIIMLPLGVFNIVAYLVSNVCCRNSDSWFDTGNDGLDDCRSISSLQIFYMVVACIMWAWYLFGGLAVALSGASMTFVSSSSTQNGNIVTTTTSATTSNNVRLNVFMSLVYSSLFIFGSSLVVFPQGYFSMGHDTVYC